jgi:hypothetical protein
MITINNIKLKENLYKFNYRYYNINFMIRNDKCYKAFYDMQWYDL